MSKKFVDINGLRRFKINADNEYLSTKDMDYFGGNIDALYNNGYYICHSAEHGTTGTIPDGYFGFVLQVVNIPTSGNVGNEIYQIAINQKGTATRKFYSGSWTEWEIGVSIQTQTIPNKIVNFNGNIDNISHNSVYFINGAWTGGTLPSSGSLGFIQTFVSKEYSFKYQILYRLNDGFLYVRYQPNHVFHTWTRIS